MNVRIKLKGKTASNWTTENPVLQARQPGFEIDTRKMKFGDGTTAWNSLPYAYYSIDEIVTLLGGKANTVHTHSISDVSGLSGALANKADLVGGLIPANQLPGFVDDILEYANIGAFPVTGESGKLYVTIDTNKTYRWTGSAYTLISDTIALGETSSTAYRGDRGKAAFDHSQASGNPHNTTPAQLNGITAVGVALTAISTPAGMRLARINADGTVSLLTAKETREMLGFNYVELAADQVTSSTSASDLTGMAFSLEANAKYIITVYLRLGCSNTGGGKLGATWPAGAAVGQGTLGRTTSGTTQLMSAAPATNGALTGVAFSAQLDNQGYMVLVYKVEMGSTPGNFQMQFAANTAGQQFTAYAGFSAMELKRIDA